MVLLDTDVVIWILRKNPRIIELVSEIVEAEETAVSTITVAEVYKNVFPSEIVGVEEFFNQQIIFPVTVEIARSAGFYWQEYRREVEGLSLLDCLIGATAKTENSRLFSLNTRHFPMKDIKFVKQDEGGKS